MEHKKKFIINMIFYAMVGMSVSLAVVITLEKNGIIRVWDKK